MAFSEPIVVGANSFTRLDFGQYRHSATVSGSVNDLTLDGSLSPKENSLLIKRVYRSLPDAAGVVQTAQVHMVLRWHPLVSSAILNGMKADLTTFASDANIGRMILGER